MRRLGPALLLLLAGLLSLPAPARAQTPSREKRLGYCTLQNLFVPAFGCTVTVYLTGTLTKASIYSDNSGTPQSNPFTVGASTTQWSFYADNGRYDLVFSGGNPVISPSYTLSDIQFVVFSGSITAGLINNYIWVDGITNTSIAQALTNCPAAAPALCHIMIPPGVLPMSAQVIPNIGVIIEGAGATYNNAGQNCATTINWTGGATTPFVFNGTATQGSTLKGFCFNAISGAAPPYFIQDTNSAGDITLKDIVIDAPTVKATTAAISYGDTGAVVAANCDHVFVRNAAPIGFNVTNVQAKWTGQSCRALNNTVNDWVIGTAGKLVENMTCRGCTAEAASGNVGVLINNVIQFDWNDSYSECGGSATAYCFDIPASASLAQQVSITNSFAGGSNSPGTSAYVHSSLSSATITIIGNRIGDAVFANPSYIIQDDALARATLVGNNCSPTGCVPFKNGPNVTSFGNTAYAGLQPTVGPNVPILAALTTTGSTTDNVTVTGMTAAGHCTLTPTNSGAAGGLSGTYVSTKTTNQITVTHAATPGWTFDISCTPN